MSFVTGFTLGQNVVRNWLDCEEVVGTAASVVPSAVAVRSSPAFLCNNGVSEALWKGAACLCKGLQLEGAAKEHRNAACGACIFPPLPLPRPGETLLRTS